jgi:hypothetical protein
MDGTPKYNPSLNKGMNYKTKGTPFSFWKSYYVDDAVFIFLNRQEDLYRQHHPSSPHISEDLVLPYTAATAKPMNHPKLKQCTSPHQDKNPPKTAQPALILTRTIFYSSAKTSST